MSDATRGAAHHATHSAQVLSSYRSDAYALAPSNAVVAHIAATTEHASGALWVRAHDLVRLDSVRTYFETSPLLAEPSRSSCNELYANVSVELFPLEAALEHTFLSLRYSDVIRKNTPLVSKRRDIVEIGWTCASSLTEVEDRQMFSMYELDCSPSSSCRVSPSIPFWHLSTERIQIDYHEGEDTATVHMERSVVLAYDEALEPRDGEFVRHLSTFMLLSLTAVIVYMREERHQPSTNENRSEGSGDGYYAFLLDYSWLGLLSTILRTIELTRCAPHLLASKQVRMVAFQIIAICASFAEWCLRANVQSGSGPTQSSGYARSGMQYEFGGSMAIVDTVNAVLLSFTVAPLFKNIHTRFADTGRLLVGSMLALNANARCFLAYKRILISLNNQKNSAGGAQDTTYKIMYTHASMLSAFAWTLQLVASTVALADLTSTPFAYSVFRHMAGSVQLPAIAIALSIVCIGIPRLLARLAMLDQTKS